MKIKVDSATKDLHMPVGPHEIMTIDELAEYVKISKSTLYKLAQEGKLPGQKIGKRWRFHKEAIDGWLKSQPEHLSSDRNAGEAE